MVYFTSSGFGVVTAAFISIFLLLHGCSEKGPGTVPAEYPERIEKGRELFGQKCSSCHDADSNETIAGPGLKGILKKPRLPVSGKPATRENIADQLKRPYSRMPSFSYLTDEQISHIIDFLSTL